MICKSYYFNRIKKFILLKAITEKSILTSQCGTSSVGRASACQAEGRRFETGVPHQLDIQ